MTQRIFVSAVRAKVLEQNVRASNKAGGNDILQGHPDAVGVTGNGKPSDHLPPDIHLAPVQIRLPPFWPKNPGAWSGSAISPAPHHTAVGQVLQRRHLPADGAGRRTRRRSCSSAHARHRLRPTQSCYPSPYHGL